MYARSLELGEDDHIVKGGEKHLFIKKSSYFAAKE